MYCQAWCARTATEQLGGSWSAGRSTSVKCAAANGCNRPPDRDRSTPPGPRRSRGTAGSTYGTTPTLGSKRGTGPIEMGRHAPRGNCVPRLLSDLELHRPLGLLLHDDCSGRDVTALEDYVVDAKPDQIAPPQLAINGEVEQREFPRSMMQLQPNPDSPDRFQFQ